LDQSAAGAGGCGKLQEDGGDGKAGGLRRSGRTKGPCADLLVNTVTRQVAKLVSGGGGGAIWLGTMGQGQGIKRVYVCVGGDTAWQKGS
jgi:hypothetical protein